MFLLCVCEHRIKLKACLVSDDVPTSTRFAISHFLSFFECVWKLQNCTYCTRRVNRIFKRWISPQLTQFLPFLRFIERKSFCIFVLLSFVFDITHTQRSLIHFSPTCFVLIHSSQFRFRLLLIIILSVMIAINWHKVYLIWWLSLC